MDSGSMFRLTLGEKLQGARKQVFEGPQQASEKSGLKFHDARNTNQLNS